QDRGLSATHLLPTMEETEVFPHVAAAVGDASVRLGIARIRHSHDEFFERARTLMDRSERLVRALSRARLTPPMPTSKALAERKHA
ncbi:MAG: hypothetical protein WA719_05225, partial [Thermoplasmata archaeon]